MIFDLPDLVSYFHSLNEQHFQNQLPIPRLSWNNRFQTTAGRFIPGRQKKNELACIEIASYLIQEKEASDLIQQTLGHEMIHYWLWINKKPYGHTRLFLIKMREMGVPRYNPVPRSKKKYTYQCPHCLKVFFSSKNLIRYACGTCCRYFSSGKYDPRFIIHLFS